VCNASRDIDVSRVLFYVAVNVLNITFARLRSDFVTTIRGGKEKENYSPETVVRNSGS
jgi:hypothetical protein